MDLTLKYTKEDEINKKINSAKKVAKKRKK
jgi:hypothetical protein